MGGSGLSLDDDDDEDDDDEGGRRRRRRRREGEGERRERERERCVYDLPTYSIQTAREVRFVLVVGLMNGFWYIRIRNCRQSFWETKERSFSIC